MNSLVLAHYSFFSNNLDRELNGEHSTQTFCKETSKGSPVSELYNRPVVGESSG